MQPDSHWSMSTQKTPVGRIWLIAKGAKLWGAALEPRWAQQSQRILTTYRGLVSPGHITDENPPILTLAGRALDDYFAGNLDALLKIPFCLEGTELQKKVWRTVRRIRPGRTKTYGALSKQVKREGAYRAIGAANGRNPLALFIPCHRVVSSTNSLQGYSAGLRVKSYLLKHEGLPNDGVRLTP